MASRSNLSPSSNQKNSKGKKTKILEEEFFLTTSPNRHRLPETTYEIDYPPKAVEFSTSAKKKDGDQQNKLLSTIEYLNMDGPGLKDSVYKVDYDEKPLQATKNFSPSKTYSPSKVKFDERTTNQQDYDAKPLPEKVKSSIKQEYKPSGAFSEDTTHRTDFNEKPIEPRKSFSPNRGY